MNEKMGQAETAEEQEYWRNFYKEKYRQKIKHKKRYREEVEEERKRLVPSNQLMPEQLQERLNKMQHFSV